MRTQLEVRLTDSAAALPRVVACLHARAMRIEQASIRGSRCSLLVEGATDAEHLIALLTRLVDVLSVRTGTSAARHDPTRSVATHLPYQGAGRQEPVLA